MNSLVLVSDAESLTSKYKHFMTDNDETFSRANSYDVTQEINMFIELERQQNYENERMIREMGIIDFSEFADSVETKAVTTEELKFEKDDPFQTKSYQSRMSAMNPVYRNERETGSRTVKEAEVVGSRKTEKDEFTWGNDNRRNHNTFTPFSTEQPKQHQNLSSPTATPASAPTNHIFSQMGRIAKNVEALAYRTPKLDDNKQQIGWGEKKQTFWEKCKSFIGSKKVRVLAKLGAFISLQLWMAKISGRYEIKNAKEFILVIGMMLGVFYLSKELQSEGFDKSLALDI